MAESASDRDVVETIATILHSSPVDGAISPPSLARFRAWGTAALGRDLADDEIRELALEALRRLAGSARADRARKFSVVTRCDVRGEPHKVVASELGLSRSQFYRDLQRARLAIGRAVEARLRKSTHAAPIGAFDMSVATIRALHACGRTADAAAAAIALADGERGANAVIARCVAVEILADNCRVYEAVREHAKLPDIGENGALVGGDGKSTHARFMVRVAGAAIALARLDPDMEVRARHAVDAAARLDDRQGRADARALATSLLARALMERGDLAGGHALLAAYDRSPSIGVRPSLRAALISARSGLYQFEPWALGESYDQTQRLLACAVANELPRPGIDALTGFATLLCKQDNLSASEPYALAALANARSAGSSEQVATALGTMSMLLSESDRATEALHAAEAMSREIGGEGVWAVQGALLRALALLRLKRIDETLLACRNLAADATRRNDTSALGVTKRMMAEAYLLQGARREALTEIDESVSLLEGVGRPYMLLRTYAVSHRLSGNARHGSLARSLQSALRGFDARPFLPS